MASDLHAEQEAAGGRVHGQAGTLQALLQAGQRVDDRGRAEVRRRKVGKAALQVRISPSGLSDNFFLF